MLFAEPATAAGPRFCESILPRRMAFFNPFLIMPEAKIINHNTLAQKWFYDLMTRPGMRKKRGRGAERQWHSFSTARSGAESRDQIWPSSAASDLRIRTSRGVQP